MNRYMRKLSSAIGIAVLVLLPAVSHGASFSYFPQAMNLEMEPGGQQVLSLTLSVNEPLRSSAMVSFVSEISGGNLPMGWIGASPATSFIGGRALSAKTTLTIHVPEGTPPGAYSGLLKSSAMSAHGLVDPGPGLMISIQVGGCSNLPQIQISGISPDKLWPPNHSMQMVTVNGTVVMDSGCTLQDLFYSVQDEYGIHTHTGSITPGTDGSFTAAIPVEAWREGDDKDGRHYTIIIFAKNEAGTGTSLNLQVEVPHDMGKK